MALAVVAVVAVGACGEDSAPVMVGGPGDAQPEEAATTAVPATTTTEPRPDTMVRGTVELVNRSGVGAFDVRLNELRADDDWASDDNEVARTTTDATGGYVLPVPSAGVYQVTVSVLPVFEFCERCSHEPQADWPTVIRLLDDGGQTDVMVASAEQRIQRGDVVELSLRFTCD